MTVAQWGSIIAIVVLGLAALGFALLWLRTNEALEDAPLRIRALEAQIHAMTQDRLRKLDERISRKRG